MVNSITRWLQVAILLLLIQITSTASHASNCDDQFSDAFIRSVKWKVFRKIKRELIYMPHAREPIERVLQNTLGNVHKDHFAKKVRVLSNRHKTSVLIYDSKAGPTCVWLFTSSGQVFSSKVSEWSTYVMHRLHSRLGVNSDSRYVARTIRDNRSGQTCSVEASDRSLPNTDDAQYRRVRLLRIKRELKRVSDVLLPEPILHGLMSSSDTRLIVIPTYGRGLVPFAALPIGKKQLIESYSQKLVTVRIAEAVYPGW